MIQKILARRQVRDTIASLFRLDSHPYNVLGKSGDPPEGWVSDKLPEALYPISDCSPPSSEERVPGSGQKLFDMLDDGPALLIAMGRLNIEPCEEWLRSVGIEVLHRQSFNAVASLMRYRAPKVSLLLVDVDSLGGIADTIDDVIWLRDAFPAIPLILLSSRTANSDFSTERLRLCDVTLRAPVSHSSLELAIVEAACNNLAWCSRVEN